MRCRNRIQKRYPLLPYQDNRIRGGADASTPDVPAQECPSVDILGLHVCSTNVLLLRTTDLHVGTETHGGVNRGNRYEARVKINRRHGTKCTSMYISYLRVCKANTLQTRTTVVRGGSEMLRIFSSNVLLLAKLASLSGNTA